MNEVNASKRLCTSLKVVRCRNIAFHDREVSVVSNREQVGFASAPKIIQNSHVMAFGQQTNDQGRPDEAGTTGDHHAFGHA